MTARTVSRDGSFEALRDRHLFLFDGPVGLHFQERGTVEPSKAGEGRGRPPRPRWRTVGIIHFPVDPAEALSAQERSEPSAGCP